MGSTRVNLTAEKMEQLLRPELEEGRITFHDFERTKRFASVNRSYWPPMTGLLTTGLTVYYGRFYRKRPWSIFPLLLITPVAYTLGTLPGAFAQVLAFAKLERELEDPKGLFRTLANKVRLELTTSEVPTTRDPSQPKSEQGLESTEGLFPDDDQQQGRWAELRKPSASVSNSTWDSIRQSHERAAVSGTAETSQRRNPGSERSDDRQTEQAHFDALVEAERKLSSE